MDAHKRQELHEKPVDFVCLVKNFDAYFSSENTYIQLSKKHELLNGLPTSSRGIANSVVCEDDPYS